MNQPPAIFDTALIARHLARRPQAADFVTDLVLADLEDRLGALIREFPRAAIIGPDIDRLPAFGQTASARFAFERHAAFTGPDEVPALPGDDKFNLIVSLLHLQAVNDVPGYLARLRSRLAPDGLLMIAALGGETLTELREAFLSADALVFGGVSARVAPMIQVRDAGALLQRAGLALPVADVETHTVRYSSPFALMAELKALGAANPLVDRPRRLASPALLTAAANAYLAQDADPDGRIRATLEIVWLSGWVPHESQQQPLKPGSATTRLGDILGEGLMDQFAGHIVILSGSPGSGKTTTAELLARLPGSAKVHLHSDDFWGYIKQGHIDPWLPQADEQNRMVMQIAASVAAQYARNGYLVALDGVIRPWALANYRSLDVPVHYVVLRASVDEAVARCQARGGDSLADPVVVADLHAQFANLGDFERHVLPTDGLDRAGTLAAVIAAIDSGTFRLR